MDVLYLLNLHITLITLGLSWVQSWKVQSTSILINICHKLTGIGYLAGFTCIVTTSPVCDDLQIQWPGQTVIANWLVMWSYNFWSLIVFTLYDWRARIISWPKSIMSNRIFKAIKVVIPRASNSINLLKQPIKFAPNFSKYLSDNLFLVRERDKNWFIIN